MAERYTKTYVSVNVDIDEDGTMLPRLIRWMNGRVFAIEQLGYKCRASSAKVGGGGIRYTVRINGRETYLFQEGSRWFVEARGHKSRPRHTGGALIYAVSRQPFIRRGRWERIRCTSR